MNINLHVKFWAYVCRMTQAVGIRESLFIGPIKAFEKINSKQTKGICIIIRFCILQYFFRKACILINTIWQVRSKIDDEERNVTSLKRMLSIFLALHKSIELGYGRGKPNGLEVLSVLLN